ncbi:MAG: glycosyltransferase family 1 protein [Gammaproteobacteria bacterium]|nr:glycosyltransferase family 1 protein [Gammaproteobacteria bacterium]
MARILFAWECGGGLGHLTLYRELIDQLTGDGHAVVFVTRSLASAIKVFGERTVTLVQAPVRMENLEEGVPSPRSYLHVLKNQGFADAEGLFGRFKAWLALYEMWQPDLIISDHSPTAIFTAQHYPGAKLVMSGNGFMVPPDEHPFQAFPIAPHFTREVLLEEEQRFLDQHINPLMQAMGGSRYDRLCDAFKADARWICQFREIDHYPDRETANYIGPAIAGAGESPVWPAGQGSKVFAYLKPHEGLAELLSLIRQLGLPTLIKGDRLPAGIERQFTGPTIRFADKLQDMIEVANNCDLGITNGSPTITSQFLLAGKPVLMIPLHIEQLISSKAIEGIGCGIAVDYLREQPFSYPTALAELMATDNRYRRAAQDFAKAHKDYLATQVTDYMYADVNRLLNSPVRSRFP